MSKKKDSRLPSQKVLARFCKANNIFLDVRKFRTVGSVCYASIRLSHVFGGKELEYVEAGGNSVKQATIRAYHNMIVKLMSKAIK